MPKKTLSSRLLGTLKYNKMLDFWSCRFNLGKGHSIEVAINNIPDLEKALPTIDKKIEFVRKDELKFREFAAKKLLKLANDWSEGEKVTKEDFISRMRLETVEVLNDLSIGLYYDDGDLFWGHTITVDIDKNGKCTRAEFQG